MAIRKNKLDMLDERLIQLLGVNAHQTSEDLAGKLSISAATARRRLRRLLGSGALHIVAVPDRKEMGMPILTLLALKVDRDKIDEVAKTLGQRPHCQWVSSIAGKYDILATEAFESTDALAHFIQDDLTKISAVRDIETFICLHTYKVYGLRP